MTDSSPLSKELQTALEELTDAWSEYAEWNRERDSMDARFDWTRTNKARAAISDLFGKLQQERHDAQFNAEYWQGQLDLAKELWTCPDCNFAFAAEHENDDGSGYSCPVCESARLREENQRLRAENERWVEEIKDAAAATTWLEGQVSRLSSENQRQEEALVMFREEQARDKANLIALAKLSSDTPQFDNPLRVWEAQILRDEILRSLAASPVEKVKP